MKIRLSQLRTIISEEVNLLVTEGLSKAVVPTGATTPDGFDLVIDVTTVPAGVFASLRAVNLTVKIARSYQSVAGGFDILFGPKGKASKTKAEAIALLKATARKEVMKLSGNRDLRPSETARLETLQSFIES